MALFKGLMRSFEPAAEAQVLFASAGLDAALFTAGGDVAEREVSAMRTGGRLAYPNGVEPVPQSPPGISGTSCDGMPNPDAIEKLKRLIEA